METAPALVRGLCCGVMAAPLQSRLQAELCHLLADLVTPFPQVPMPDQHSSTFLL